VTTYRAQIDAAKGQDEVFEYLATFSNAREWDPGVTDGEALTPGPAVLGSVYRLGVRIAGRSRPFDYRVIDIERPRRVVLQARHGRIVSTDTITVEWAGSRSRVRYEAVLEGRGMLRLASPVIARVFSSMAERATAGLRTALA
jgi:Polyketide cyclase / dehydrase and lipid transport